MVQTVMDDLEHETTHRSQEEQRKCEQSSGQPHQTFGFLLFTSQSLDACKNLLGVQLLIASVIKFLELSLDMIREAVGGKALLAARKLYVHAA